MPRTRTRAFCPSTGTIRALARAGRRGVRVDTGFRAGDAVTPYYDALLAKLIAWATTAAGAGSHASRRLGEFEIAGVTTNLAFLRALMRHPQVVSGDIDTGFIERELSALTAAAPMAALDMAAACAAVLRREEEERIAARIDLPSPWDRTDGWMLAGRRSRRLSFRHGSRRFDAVLWYDRDGIEPGVSRAAERRVRVRAQERADSMLLSATRPERGFGAWSGRDLDLTTPRGHLDLHWIDPFAAEMRRGGGGRRIVAPMPGTVTRILAEPGADLQRGAPLLVLEAMKMEHTLRAPGDGRLKALKCAVGDFVQEGTELADFELSSEDR